MKQLAIKDFNKRKFIIKQEYWLKVIKAIKKNNLLFKEYNIKHFLLIRFLNKIKFSKISCKNFCVFEYSSRYINRKTKLGRFEFKCFIDHSKSHNIKKSGW